LTGLSTKATVSKKRPRKNRDQVFVRHRGKFFFSEVNDPSKRFELEEDKIGETGKYLVPNTVIAGVRYEGKIINITLPSSPAQSHEAAPGMKGDRATWAQIGQSGDRATIQVPLFVEQGDVIEINTETGEYTKRV